MGNSSIITPLVGGISFVLSVLTIKYFAPWLASLQKVSLPKFVTSLVVRVGIAFVVVGGMGMLGTPIAGWLRSLSSWASQTTTGWIGLSVVIIYATYSVGHFLMSMLNGNLTKQTLYEAGFAPFLVTLIPGPVGMFLVNLADTFGASFGQWVQSGFTN
ncbi:hypothetical protein ACFC1T_08765 [Kitasatospora sp. NPDC056076]|uniref:hypothetical protein n=1 Tax=Kitasatospora sp. NPDC056076 TaxID=3345703 RepID=UPI0035D76B02